MNRCLGVSAMVVAGCLGYGSAYGADQFSGVYGGVFGSHEWYDLSATVEDTSLNVLSASGLAGGVFAGFGVGYDDWYLTLEGDFGLSGADETLDSLAGVALAVPVTVDAKRTWGALMRYGYSLFEDGFVYGSIGWGRTRFSSAATVNGTQIKDALSLNGLRYGAGIEYELSRRFRIRLDYLHTNYESSSFIVPVGTDTVSISLNPSRDEVRAGLAVRF